MKNIHISSESTGPESLLFTALQEMEERGARVYETVIYQDQKPMRLITTSKDIHLLLGSLTEEGRRAFAFLVKCEFCDNAELLLTGTRPGDSPSKKIGGILITNVSANNQVVVCTLSQAN